MTAEEIKTLLLSGEEDGADRASIYDQVVSDITETTKTHEETSGKLAEANSRIEDLNKQLSKLTETNLKLLDKIKYVTTNDEGGDDGSDDEPEVEIADLNTWYEED